MVSGHGCWCFLGLLGDAVPFQVHVKLRPHVQQFLQSLSKTYEVPGAPMFPRGLQGAGGVPLCRGGGHLGSLCRDLHLLPQIFIFTTMKQDYAEKVVDVLDTKKKLIR